jgi:hypothetical protein
MCSGFNRLGTTVAVNLQTAAQPGTGTGTQPSTPSKMTQCASQVAVTSDGQSYIFVGAMWGAGLWRYVEP